MKKQTIRLNEEQFNNLVKKTVKSILKEDVVNRNNVKIAVAEQIVAMIENNVIEGNGIESFVGWCEDGDVFYNNTENEEFTNACIELVNNISPIVDKLSQALNPHTFD